MNPPAGIQLFDGPGRQEAAKGAHSLTKSSKFIDRPADDDRTNERIEKYGDPSASNHVASSGAVDRTNKLTEKYADPSESNHVASNDAEYSTAAATCNAARSGLVIGAPRLLTHPEKNKASVVAMISERITTKITVSRMA